MRGWLIGLVAVACGIAGWEVVYLMHPAQEPWDVKEYWFAVYPGMLVISALLGYLAPALPCDGGSPWFWDRVCGSC